MTQNSRPMTSEHESSGPCTAMGVAGPRSQPINPYSSEKKYVSCSQVPDPEGCGQVLSLRSFRELHPGTEPLQLLEGGRRGAASLLPQAEDGEEVASGCADLGGRL